MGTKWARPWFAGTAACVVVGVVVQMILAWRNNMPVLAATGEPFQTFGGSPAGRALNVLAFFTVQSNLIVGGTCLLLTLNPSRTSTVFRVFRLIGVVAIAVTGLVYHVALNNLLELDTWALVADRLLHLVVPILAVLGWLAFGPRGVTSPRVVTLTVLYPLAYMAFTAVRGPLSSNWYPYPFADVHALGYLRVILNGLWICLLFVALAAAAAWLDKRLPGKPLGPPAHPGPSSRLQG
ncbi:Pr6Pr family membrane protein [Catenulispora pinisilvae]|uniref:Pr6Pr family membrane protein n=1 Tax=Catenulispora pinisilvae TaxID=2705253 RepID=UPI001890E5FC|nr:Pr6Pr family membrane protein [Catenulispora pinisilvae]